MPNSSISRRDACRSLAGAAASIALPPISLAAPVPAMIHRRIPGHDESVPVVGMGSSNTFDVGNAETELAPLREVLRALVSAGGTVIDTSPMYGRAENVLGALIEELAFRPRLFVATKVWTSGREAGARQIERSMQALRVSRLDLLQIHNLVDWREHVPTLRALQESGKLRYAGITHYRADAHRELERVLAAERFDWLQVNYSLAEPEAEQRLLPFCRDHGIAVLVNRPFADGAMFGKVRDRPPPAWAAEFGCSSWGQFFLKWVIAHPAVTCAIPATSSAAHMRDDCAAGSAPLPDEAQRRRMREYFESL